MKINFSEIFSFFSKNKLPIALFFSCLYLPIFFHLPYILITQEYYYLLYDFIIGLSLFMFYDFTIGNKLYKKIIGKNYPNRKNDN